MPTFFHTSVKALSSEGWITETELGFVRPQLLSQKLKAKWIRACLSTRNEQSSILSLIILSEQSHSCIWKGKKKYKIPTYKVWTELFILFSFSPFPLLSAYFRLYPPLAQPPFNGVCFYWCSRGKQGIVWTGSGLRSADRSGGWFRAVLELPASSLF